MQCNKMGVMETTNALFALRSTYRTNRWLATPYSIAMSSHLFTTNYKTILGKKSPTPEGWTNQIATRETTRGDAGHLVQLSANTGNNESRLLSGLFFVLDHFVMQRLEFHHDLVGGALTALPCVNSGDGRLVDASATLDFHLRQIGGHQFGNECLSGHVTDHMAYAISDQVLLPLSKAIGF